MSAARTAAVIRCTSATITDAEILSLRAGAIIARDLDLVATCDAALGNGWSSAGCRRICAQVINAANLAVRP